MKKYFFIFILINFSIQLSEMYSDNWEPFPINQVSYYKIVEVNKSQSIMYYENKDLIGAIGIITFDSLFDTKINGKYFYSSKINQLKSDTCLISKLVNIYDDDKLTRFSPDFYSVINDTITVKINFLEQNTNYDLKIPINMNTGDIYIQNSTDSSISYEIYSMEVKITLKSKEKGTTFGIEDSLQFFEVERKRLPNTDDRTFQLVLSKRFGLIKFFPLDILYLSSLTYKINQIELVSAQKNSVNYGESYNFQYMKKHNLEKTGDVRIFKDVWRSNIFEFDYYRDSIIAITDEGEEILVFYNRQSYSSNPWTRPHEDKTDSYKYPKSDTLFYWGYNATIDYFKNGLSFIPTTKLFPRRSNHDTEDKTDSVEIIVTPVLFKISERCGNEIIQIYYHEQSELNRIDCSIKSIDAYHILDPILYEWWYHYPWIDVYEGNRVTGYRDGDCEWGDLTWPPKGVSIRDYSEPISFLFPNPTMEKININNFSDGSISYEIYDNLGIKRSEGFFEKEIDVSFLLPGVYFLKLNNQKPMKFIKI